MWLSDDDLGDTFMSDVFAATVSKAFLALIQLRYIQFFLISIATLLECCFMSQFLFLLMNSVFRYKKTMCLLLLQNFLKQAGIIIAVNAVHLEKSNTCM